ncbi:hypothetical protein JANAI62_31170 [Jannaschia pagri]|uniref:Glycerophosphoryl diester phosphodiesterase membrane domain-containing protein n=1 Tax=Jannaschia pagri TaxID=2829797 RepID=A0ABQ4NQG9_9RHOB|nr:MULTISPECIES: hypothetical protein [unclassified Jannaschia]GIT92646.1 hypothetical protein JANAI61_31040 [Jannaschia sp. AI_61]GIT96494.1 hypothetical protein JANAI62_31170 [Jannaschia sp. AI_62]
MLSWNIFKRAALLVIDNLGAALRLSVVPYGLLVVASFYFIGSLDVTSWQVQLEVGPEEMPNLPDGFLGGVLALSLVQLGVYIWIAIAWHRYILLQEGGEGWLPSLSTELFVGYLWRLILLILVMVAVLIAVTLALTIPLPVVGIPVSIILGILIFYRLGLVLPAVAVGNPMTLPEAWAATKGQSGTVITLAVLSFVLSLLFELPALVGGADPSGLVSMVYNLVVGWFLILLGVSVLSTLYGHFVEGRSVE